MLAPLFRALGIQLWILLLLDLRVANGAVAAPDPIGLITLRTLAPDVTGSGVSVAQPEAGNPSWQVNPVVVSQPASLFTWIASTGTAGIFPNTIGSESEHASQVGGVLYGGLTGVAPGLAHVDNYEADYFYTRIQNQTAAPWRVANQSFIFGGQLTLVDRDYDNYAARYGVLFVSGAGNEGAPSSPSTAYNGLCVAAFNGTSSIGPTSDGRSKPDLTAPAGQTSFSTPRVTGAAALLLQAAARDTGGAGTAASAGDYRTLKALLMNGATKPARWTNGVTAPLDARHGAGVLNVFNAYRQLRGGKHGWTMTTTHSAGSAHPSPSMTNGIPARRGWDFGVMSSSITLDRVNHYYFEVTGGAGRLFDLTATLVWSRPLNRTTINDLDLFLFDADTGALMASSQSAVNNVEHVHVAGIPAGRYVLQVLKNGGLLKRITNDETYALAFDWGPPEVARMAGVMNGGGIFGGQLTGEPYERYVIEAASGITNWFPVLTNMAGANGLFDFLDSGSPGSPGRIYRSKLAP